MTKSNAPHDKVPLPQILAFGAGAMSNQIFDWGIQYIVLQVFGIALGVNPFLVGLAQSIARGLDLVTDPLAGYLADSLRHRIGLRTYLVAGSLTGGLFFALIWLVPPGLSTTAEFVWLLVCFSITMIAWSFFSVPRAALGIEMTSEPYERAKLMTISGFMAIALNFCLCWSYAATQLPIFGGTLPGARWVGGAMGAGIAAFGLIAATYCRGGGPMPQAVEASAAHPRASSWADFGVATQRVVKCRPLALLAGSFAVIQLGLIAVDVGLLPYILIYHVGGGSQARGAVLLGAAATAWLVAALAVSAPVFWLSQRLGKKNTLLIFLSLTLAGSSMRWFFYNPNLPYAMMIPFALYGCGTGAFFLLAPAMTADACDWEESISGFHDSGMFSAFFGWANKLGTTLGTLASGFLINLAGFSAVHGGLPSHAILLRMKFIDTFVPTTALVVGIALIAGYPLTARRMESVRATLLARGGARPPGAI